jgi:hypothetical protein
MEQPQDHAYSDAESAFSSTESEASDEAAKKGAISATSRRTYADYKKVHPHGDLCQRCAGINWTNLLSDNPFHDRTEWDELSLFCVPETSQELSVSSCSLCRLMGSDLIFGKNSKRTLSVYNACDSVRYFKGHDTNDWRQYTPGLILGPCHARQERFEYVHR